MENTSANFEQLDFLNDIDDQYLMNVLEQPVINTKPRPQNFFTNLPPWDGNIALRFAASNISSQRGVI